MIERFFVFHGAAIALAFAVVFVVGGALVGFLRQRRKTSKFVARSARLVGEPSTIDERASGLSAVTLSGRLEVRGDACHRFEDGAPAAAATATAADPFSVSVRAEHLDFVTDQGERMALEGAVEVVLGSRLAFAPRAWEDLPEEVHNRLTKAHGILAPSDVPACHSLDHGDEVLVRGALRREESPREGAGYRMSGAARAVGAPDRAPGSSDVNVIRLAYRGRPASASRVVAPLRGALFGTLAYAVVFLALPEVMARIQGTSHPFFAAGPLHRGRAFDKLVEPYDEVLGGAAFDPALFESVIDLRLRGNRCGEAVTMLYERRQFDRAARVALLCDLSWVAQRAEYRSGQFDGALDLWVDGQGKGAGGDLAFPLRVALLAGNLAVAASVARNIARTWGPGSRREDFGCIADALDVRLGVTGARQSLSQGKSAACATLLLDVTPVAERGALSRASCSRLGSPSALEKELEDLLTAPECSTDRAPPAVHGHLTLLLPSWSARDAALATEAIERLDADPEKTTQRRRLLSRLSALLANFEFFSGELERALVWSQRAKLEATALMETEAPYPKADLLGEARELEDILQGIHRGKGPVGRDIIDPLEVIKARSLEGTSNLSDGAGKAVSASRGAGVELAFLLWRSPATTEGLLRSIAVTDHDEAGRLALLRWLRWGKDEVKPPPSALAAFADASARLFLAEKLRDEPLADELRSTVRAFRSAFLRRETAVPLALADELLGEPSSAK